MKTREPPIMGAGHYKPASAPTWKEGFIAALTVNYGLSNGDAISLFDELAEYEAHDYNQNPVDAADALMDSY